MLCLDDAVARVCPGRGMKIWMTVIKESSCTLNTRDRGIWCRIERRRIHWHIRYKFRQGKSTEQLQYCLYEGRASITLQGLQRLVDRGFQEATKLCVQAYSTLSYRRNSMHGLSHVRGQILRKYKLMLGEWLREVAAQ
jgi:hypothetical protein